MTKAYCHDTTWQRIRVRCVWCTLMLIVLGGCGGGSAAVSAPGNPPPQTPPATIGTEPAFANLAFTEPLAMLQAPGDDSRWFVVERRGTVRVFDNDAGVARSDVFVDLSGQVDAGPGEAGLLGMAFDPDFATNGRVYLSYTVTGSPLISRIDRFTSNDNGRTLDPAAALPVLSVAQNQANHNGGQLQFGPDGLLYASFGDGGGAGDPANNAQTTSNLLGTIIRIDVRDPAAPYSIPTDNPYAANPLCSQGSGSAACPEIFAYGLRNPWRFSFDRQTGELYAGDVGQNSFEEIDRIAIGDNLGWNIREGANCFGPANCTTAGLVDPIHEYAHDVGASVTGGYVYRGSEIPALVGRYVFGDFVSGRVWAIDASAQGLVASEELSVTPFNIASFGESASGELYLVDFGGSLHRLVAN